MFNLFNKKNQKRKLDRKILRKNDISLLIVDERWNSLFANTPKAPDISACEEKLRGLLKEQARLTSETKEIAFKKKLCMDKIIKLTTEAFENNNQEARNEMQACEKEIKRINERLVKIEEEQESIPEHIKETNLELLEHMINHFYVDIRQKQKRVSELEKLIEETREKLKQYIDEKESLAEGSTDTYSYFHDLLGGEELEKLDREYFDE